MVTRVGGVVTETDLVLGWRRTLHVYDTGGDDARLTVLWQHGTPNTGELPAPLLQAAAARGIRWVSFDRPGYGTSTQQAGRDVAAVAGDAADVADALGIGRFAVLGHSGGGPHALACAALLPDRVQAVAAMSGLAPFAADGLDWFARMAPGATALLHAAAAGPVALKDYLATTEFDMDQFTPADIEALTGGWAWLGEVAGKAIAADHGGHADDELAFVAPWGFDPAQITTPVLVVHGGQDRLVPSSHGEWLARRCPGAELWLRPEDGHISVLNCGEAVLGWLS
jgi:pimeloyl-ACP methyl ester carboxylesterase